MVKPGKPSDYGLNGEHRLLGNQISNAEFKGFVTAELRNIKEHVKELTPRVDRNEKLLYLGTGGLGLALIILQVL